MVNVAEMLFPTLEKQLKTLESVAFQTSANRLELLNKLSDYLLEKKLTSSPIALNFICTHNSRRSHLAQAWAKAWVQYYKLEQILLFSGGTEATAFHPNAIKTLQTSGFEITSVETEANPKYLLKTGPADSGLTMFSKKYDDTENPKSGFAAIMVCSDADEACPFLTGSEIRLALAFDDPKKADGRPEEADTYYNTSSAIASQLGYVFRRLSLA